MRGGVGTSLFLKEGENTLCTFREPISSLVCGTLAHLKINLSFIHETTLELPIALRQVMPIVPSSGSFWSYASVDLVQTAPPLRIADTQIETVEVTIGSDAQS